MSRLHYYLSRRIMTGRSERLHPGDVSVFIFCVLGFLFLFFHGHFQ